MLGLFTTLLCLVWSAGAQVIIDPTAIFTPDAPVEVVLDFDNYTRVLVRESTRVTLDCSNVFNRFIASQEKLKPSRVTVQWLFMTELPDMTIHRVSSVVMDGEDSGRIRIAGDFNEILNITDIRLPKLAVDGTTGVYSCEVCRDERAECVNSSIPVLGRNFPPDINDGRPDETCSVVPFFQLTTCNVGTNYCINDTEDHNLIQLLCFHNSSAQPTPIPRIGVWFINGEQVSSSVDGSKLPGVTDAISLNSEGRRLQIDDVANAPRGNYTCKLTNVAGFDTATSIITACRKNPPDIRDGEPEGTCMINPMSRITTCDVGTDYSIDPDENLRSLRLLCQQNASAPPTPEPLIGVWYLNGEQISSRQDGSKLPGVTNSIVIDNKGESLRIINFENAPRGNYTCQLVNSIGADTATTIISDRVVPGEPPEIITDPLSPGGIDVVTIGNSACFNDSILINCSLRAGTRPVMYEWTRDGETITVPSPTHLLHVNKPGNYSCMVMNSFGHDTASSVVGGHPVVDLITTVIGARNDGGCDRLNPRPKGVDICPLGWETVTFICQHDADRLSSIPSILTPYGPGPSQFYLNNCSGVLDGHYSCSSSNECGTATHSVRLQVFNPAKINRRVRVPESTPSVTHIGAGQSSEPVQLFAGGHAVLYCPSSGDEQPLTRWFKRGNNNTLIPVSNTNHTIINTTTIQSLTTLVLSLPRLRERDFGEYVCIAHNRAGREEARVILREIGVWQTDDWSMCSHRRRVTCIGAVSGQPLDDEDACCNSRPARVSQCIY